ncbi:MAG: hypothetical protein WC376_00600 [Candidatus Nanoarchaeia archaeon]
MGIYNETKEEARYTQMSDISSKEKTLYDKWMNVFGAKTCHINPKK